MSIGAALRGLSDVSMIHATDPVEAATLAGSDSDCTVVAISPHDSILDVHALLAAAAPSSLVFIAELPLKPSVARLIRTSGHAVLRRGEPAIVVAATVVALLAPAAVAGE